MTIATAGDDHWMAAAISRAKAAERAGDVPIGAIIVRDGTCVAKTENRTERDQDPTGHAEVLAIRDAAKALESWRLTGCTLYVTLEPCAMCAGAIVLSRMDRVVFGAWDDKAGMVGSVGDLVRHARLNHHPEVRAGVLADACGEVLSAFFRARRGFVDTSPGAG